MSFFNGVTNSFQNCNPGIISHLRNTLFNISTKISCLSMKKFNLSIKSRSIFAPEFSKHIEQETIHLSYCSSLLCLFASQRSENGLHSWNGEREGDRQSFGFCYRHIVQNAIGNHGDWMCHGQCRMFPLPEYCGRQLLS